MRNPIPVLFIEPFIQVVPGRLGIIFVFLSETNHVAHGYGMKKQFRDCDCPLTLTLHYARNDKELQRMNKIHAEL